MAIGALLFWNAAILYQLHPYQYLYYNPLVGGLEGASGLYVTDYWVNIMPEAVDDLEAYVATLDKAGDRTHRYSVAVCGERLPFEKEAGKRLQWTEDWENADFFIAPTHMNCDRALDGKVIATITRLGARIGVVKDHRSLVRPELAHHQSILREKNAPAGGAGGRLDPVARGDVRGSRIERPTRGLGRFGYLRCLDRLARRPIGGRPAEAGLGLNVRLALNADHRAIRRRSRARSCSSSVGSFQNGDEKASCTSDRLMPISASMRRSRPASMTASRLWRRTRANCFSQ